MATRILQNMEQQRIKNSLECIKRLSSLAHALRVSFADLDMSEVGSMSGLIDSALKEISGQCDEIAALIQDDDLPF